MKKRPLLYLAAFLALFTFGGHSIGVISNRPPEELPGFATYELMKRTNVNFPMGFSRNITTLMLGSNLCLSVFLLTAGLMCLVFARKTTWSAQDHLLVLINAGGLLLTGVISGFCFFPVPAAFLVLAAVASTAAVFTKS